MSVASSLIFGIGIILIVLVALLLRRKPVDPPKGRNGGHSHKSNAPKDPLDKPGHDA